MPVKSKTRPKTVLKRALSDPLLSPATCIMDILPTEMIRHIFSFLPYHDIRKTVRGTCKHFAAIVDNPSETGPIDIALYRDKPKSAKPAAKEYEVHPAFEMFTYPYRMFEGGEIFYLDTFTLNIPAERERRIQGGMEYTGTVLPSICIMEENAVTPAVSKLVVHVGDFPPINVSAKKDTNGGRGGVTVADVTDAIMLLLCQPITISERCGAVLMENRRLRMYAQLDGSYGPCADIDEFIFNGHLTKGSLMMVGYQCIWEGIYKAEVLDGVVHLYVIRPPTEFVDIGP